MAFLVFLAAVAFKLLGIGIVIAIVAAPFTVRHIWKFWKRTVVGESRAEVQGSAITATSLVGLPILAVTSGASFFLVCAEVFAWRELNNSYELDSIEMELGLASICGLIAGIAAMHLVVYAAKHLRKALHADHGQERRKHFLTFWICVLILTVWIGLLSMVSYELAHLV
jgi:hypothetical protein